MAIKTMLINVLRRIIKSIFFLLFISFNYNGGRAVSGSYSYVALPGFARRGGGFRWSPLHSGSTLAPRHTHIHLLPAASTPSLVTLMQP
jgi:hypothetical protein